MNQPALWYSHARKPLNLKGRSVVHLSGWMLHLSVSFRAMVILQLPQGRNLSRLQGSWWITNPHNEQLKGKSLKMTLTQPKDHQIKAQTFLFSCYLNISDLQKFKGYSHGLIESLHLHQVWSPQKMAPKLRVVDIGIESKPNPGFTNI